MADFFICPAQGSFPGLVFICTKQKNQIKRRIRMDFFNSAIEVLQTLVTALGAGLGVWGIVNLLEGYGNDNPGAKSQGMKHYMPE